MRRTIAILAGTAGVLATFVPALADDGSVPASFEMRWLPQATVAKGDRLPGVAAGETTIVKYVDPRLRMTVVHKMTRPSAPQSTDRRSPLPHPSKPDKPKTPFACEPSFSPVTVPSMAGISGRCLAHADPHARMAAVRP